MIGNGFRPLIGITGRRLRLSLIDGADARYGDRCIDTAVTDYAAWIAAAGGLPVHLSYDTDVAGICDWLSGVIITGGQDVHPSCWGGDVSAAGDLDPRTHPMAHDRARDDYEIALVREAVARDIPVLGVCRGMQVLNVALGGTLVADLPRGDVRHLSACSAPTDGTADHRVSFAPGSVVADLFGPRAITNSWHHQAVDRCGDGLAATGWTSDGVIEAVELVDRPVLGVQWHPEWTVTADPTMTWIVQQAARHCARPGLDHEGSHR